MTPTPGDLLPAEGWTKYRKAFTINVPANSESLTCNIILGLKQGGATDSQIWIDDVCLGMLAPEGVEK